MPQAAHLLCRFHLTAAYRAAIVYNKGDKGAIMKTKLFLACIILIVACASRQSTNDIVAAKDMSNEVATGPTQDFTRFVNPMIGTRGQGNVVPGPCMPHGMVKLSPDTLEDGTSIHAYEYSRKKLVGFSFLHREGPGGSGNGYAQLLFTATMGALKTTESDYASTFSHDRETAEPGYYKVNLADYGIRAELTATRQAGIQRYTFTRDGQAHILVDTNHCKGQPLDADIQVQSPDTIRGWASYQVYPIVAYGVSKAMDDGTGMDKVYFVARFSKPFSGFGTWTMHAVQAHQARVQGKGIGAYADFNVRAGESIEVRVGISMISVDQARKNLDAQVGNRAFDEIRHTAKDAWNRVLGRVEVTGDERAKTRFYTALYHSMMQPSDYTETGGRYFSAADGKGRVFQAGTHDFYTDDWCIWDTFRTTHPLLTLLDPQVAGDSAWSLVHLYKTGGWLPKCTWNATGYSRVMTGNPQFCVLAEAYLKGIKDIDVQDAWQGMYKGATRDTPNILSKTMCGYLDLGTPPEYVKMGYIPAACDKDQAVSLTLELAYADWCAAQLGAALGKKEARDLQKRSHNWVNVFNPEHGMMQQKDKNGHWVTPFDPTASAGFTEADSWQYTWFVPHDLCGLVKAMGGVDKFISKLDAFFDQGHFTIDNEPDFYTPWLYDVAGMPSKTSARVHRIMQASFTDGPDGLPGNDDAGATSAWFVFASMGMYPVNPPDRRYWLNAPLFDHVVIHVDPDDWNRVFVIDAPGAPEKQYIESATLNGKPLTVPWITHAQVKQGGYMELTLSAKPTKWGVGTMCR